MPRGLCCLPIKIKSRYYPLVFIALMTIMFQNISFSLLTGMGLGYATVFGYCKSLETSTESLKTWEGRWPFSTYSESRSFRKGPHSSSRSRNSGNISGGPGGLMNYFGGGNSSATSTE